MTRVADDPDHRDVSLAQLLIKYQTEFTWAHELNGADHDTLIVRLDRMLKVCLDGSQAVN